MPRFWLAGPKSVTPSLTPQQTDCATPFEDLPSDESYKEADTAAATVELSRDDSKTRRKNS
jgi:hypothetical protein